MASINYIQQKHLNPTGGHTDGLSWSYLNTTFQEESLLLKHGFVQLYILEELGELTDTQQLAFVSLSERFFGQGMFLTLDHFRALNNILAAHGHQKIVAVYPDMEEAVPVGRVFIVLDGAYDQPIKKGAKNKSPNAKGVAAWKENGKRRLGEFDRLLEHEKAKLERDSYLEFERSLTEATVDGLTADDRSFRREGKSGESTSETASLTEFL